MKRVLFFTLACLLALSKPLNAQSVPPEAFQDFIQEFMEKKNIPGLFITVVSADSILWQKGMGHSDLLHEVPVDPETLFRIGSVSKTFTAIAIMKLVREGKLHLDSELKEIAPEIPFENKWEEDYPVKVKHLLEHKAGFDDMHFSTFATGLTPGMTAREEVSVYEKSLKSRWKPGLVHSYSNPGYIILGYLIEKITGQPYQKYIRNHVLFPLNMTWTQFISENMRNLPSSQFSKGYEGKQKLAKSNNLTGEAVGGLLSNAEDMSRFLQYLLNEELQNSIPLIGKRGVEEMEELHGWFENANNIEKGYSLGLYTRNFGENELKFLGHNGFINGFATDFIYSRDLNLGIAISNNRGAGNGPLLDILVDHFAGKDSLGNVCTSNAQEIPSKFEAWEGEYRILNSRNEIFSLFNYPFHILKLKKEGDSIAIERLGSEESYSWCSGNAFIENGEVVPSLFLTDNDGEKSLYYYEDVLVPVSSTWILTLRTLLILGLLAGLTITILFLIRLISFAFTRNRKDRLYRSIILALPYWLIFSSLIIFLLNSSLDSLKKLGSISFLSIFIFITSLLAPFLFFAAVYFVQKQWNSFSTTGKFLNGWYIMGSAIIIAYCTFQGWFAIMLWNY
ncbi:serine hydrolase [Salegentibacter sp. Hel_I_6]|uniref:serine hydrolase domain-containing protein n=1 Tax=Salegentibacter sp. Hel_I_6 TaxID=1250278 RepID=UPI000568F973|nr:serine hydrolase domain-containing protein [Salegentibacter sp. Hel_I_6]